MEQKNQKKEKLRLLRNENREKALEFIRKSDHEKEERDKINERIQNLKKQRRSNYDKRDKLVQEKQELSEKLNKETNGKVKKQLYEKIKELKSNMHEYHVKAKEFHEQIQKMAEISQKHHTDSIAFRMMSKQAHSAADDYHDQLVEVAKEVKNVQKRLRKVK